MEKLLIAVSLSCLVGCTEDQHAGGYPDFKLNTNLLAGQTQSIAIVRSFLDDSATNSARLMDRHTRLNQQLDWLAAQPQQTPTNYDSVIRTSQASERTV